jgi:hypothetical protein
MQHYYEIAERGDGPTWWIGFPGQDGMVSAADDRARKAPAINGYRRQAVLGLRHDVGSIVPSSTPRRPN